MDAMRVTLTLSDDAKTFTVESVDVVAQADADRVLRALPDEVKSALRAGVDERLAAAREERDLLEAARANALARRKERDSEVANLEAIADTLPEAPVEDAEAPAEAPASTAKG